MPEKDNTSLLTDAAMTFIRATLGAERDEICGIKPTKTGMTNRSFRFTCRGTEYILRVPGEGTDKLINRKNEAENYKAMAGDTITDHLLALDPNTGYKLTKFWPKTRNCDPENRAEVKKCMEFLRAFHEKRLTVPHTFDLFRDIDFYESLMGQSEYPDYDQVKARCMAMKPFLEGLRKDCVLTHVDAVPDNFLFVTENGTETIHLIDWEYAGMHDPHLDIAMFAIYSGYDREILDRLMEWYFGGDCGTEIRLKIYCYTALSGLLWSNWCEYKKALGVDFGDYARMQYRYASDYSELFLKEYTPGGGKI